MLIEPIEIPSNTQFRNVSIFSCKKKKKIRKEEQTSALNI